MRTSQTRALGRFVLAAVAQCVLVTGAVVLLNPAHAADGGAAAAGKEEGSKEGWGSDWKTWRAGTDVENVGSLQRGARDFASYCLGCHSLKYERWSRMAKDLDIPEDILAKDVLPPGDKPANYILTSMPAADAETWFGKTPPDLSLMARARGKDYLYRFLTTFYVDPTRPTNANNLQLPATAMPAVLSELEGVKRAVYKNEETQGAEGKTTTEPVFDHFEQVAPGRLSRAEYEEFVRDIVNFLDYVGEPAQAARRSLGIWVVLFLLVFTWLAWLMKKEFWKDVH
jgi:ubiquinol-cytochrome c reductase cytochrome c1 subunit